MEKGEPDFLQQTVLLCIISTYLGYQQQEFPLCFLMSHSHNIFFVTFESIRILKTIRKSLQYNEIPHFNLLSPISDLDRVSSYTISTISSRQVMKIYKNINKEIY